MNIGAFQTAFRNIIMQHKAHHFILFSVSSHGGFTAVSCKRAFVCLQISILNTIFAL